jgi:hypothetical protein
MSIFDQWFRGTSTWFILSPGGRSAITVWQRKLRKGFSSFWPRRQNPSARRQSCRAGSAARRGTHCRHEALPPDCLRWQVGCKIREASLRDRVASTLSSKWRNRLDLLCQLLPNREGPELEVCSGVFECPDTIWSSGRTRPLLDSGVSLAPATDRPRPKAIGPNAF